MAVDGRKQGLTQDWGCSQPSAVRGLLALPLVGEVSGELEGGFCGVPIVRGLALPLVGEVSGELEGESCGVLEVMGGLVWLGGSLSRAVAIENQLWMWS